MAFVWICCSSGSFSISNFACARNPIRGSGFQIFCTPAVNVTANSQTSGIRVMSANAGGRFRGPSTVSARGSLSIRAERVLGVPVSAIFKMMVVARQSAIAASI